FWAGRGRSNAIESLSRAAFFEGGALFGTQRLELRVALVEALGFGGCDGRTNAEARRHGDLPRMGFGICDEFGYALDSKRWADHGRRAAFRLFSLWSRSSEPNDAGGVPCSAAT